MNIELLILVVLILLIVACFKKWKIIGRRAWGVLAISLATSLTGCVGTLSWLGAETSGNTNLFSEVNPYFWTGLFLIGLIFFIASLIMLIRQPKKG